MDPLHQRPPRRASVEPLHVLPPARATMAHRTRNYRDTLILRPRSLYCACIIALLHLWCLLVHCETVPVSSHSPALPLPKHPLRLFDSILAPVIGKSTVPSASIAHCFIEDRKTLLFRGYFMHNAHLAEKQGAAGSAKSMQVPPLRSIAGLLAAHT
ncbi:hypothetical protein DE146DRAFT_111876 [Phaeosphaeria sp. MPI-PUGE-AT-0046c]|nr:hypothetical protein DE146DRAFT_111876 [Phaeosphaeria sp. MPI-PUGE-AT-0046c]